MSGEGTQMDGKSSWMVAIDDLPIAYAEMDREGRMVRVNRSLCQLFHVEKEQVLGQAPWDIMPGRDGELNREAYRALMESGGPPPPIRRVLFSPSGAFRTYELHRTLICDQHGQPSGVRAVILDITEADLKQEELNKSRIWLTSIMASIEEAVIVTDSLGFVRYINPAAERITGWKSEEFLGMVIEKGLPVLAYRSNDGAPLNFNSMIDTGWKGTATLLDRNRQELNVEINAAPIVDAQKDCTLGVVRIIRKITSPDLAAV